MHQVIYDTLGLDWKYIKREIRGAGELQGFMNYARSNPCLGFNVTIPHKQTVMEYLDEVDPAAARVGAVNTVRKEPDGKLAGFNTDWKGFLEDIKASLGVDPAGKKAALIGCGGAARAVIEAFRYASETSELSGEVYLYDIESEKARELAADAGRVPGALSVYAAEDADSFGDILGKVSILVNASPAGMGEGDEPPIETGLLKRIRGLAVYDLIYNRRTELLKEAGSLGLSNSGGAGMLAGQGLEAFKIWYRRRVNPRKQRKIKEKMTRYLKERVGSDD